MRRILISFVHWVEQHKHVRQSLRPPSRPFEGLILVCSTTPSTVWKSDFRPGLIPTERGITSRQIPTQPLFLAIHVSTSKGPNPLGNLLEPLKWCQGVSVTSSRCETAARFPPTPCGASLWSAYFKRRIVERHHRHCSCNLERPLQAWQAVWLIRM